MPTFGTRSLLQLETCHEDIRRVLNEAIKHADFSVNGSKNSTLPSSTGRVSRHWTA